jgi:hypothetical protein
MFVFIPGARRTGAAVAETMAVSMSGAKPCADDVHGRGHYGDQVGVSGEINVRYFAGNRLIENVNAARMAGEGTKCVGRDKASRTGCQHRPHVKSVFNELAGEVGGFVRRDACGDTENNCRHNMAIIPAMRA